jgi:hypothetical protein
LGCHFEYTFEIASKITAGFNVISIDASTI